MDRPQRGYTLAEILGHDKGDSPDAQLCRIWLDLFYSSAEYEDVLFQLPFYDRYIWLVSCFSWQVGNGGIDQFLFNSSGDYVVETLEALAAIGASKSHRALQQACALFPNGTSKPRPRDSQDQVREINARFGTATLMTLSLWASWSPTWPSCYWTFDNAIPLYPNRRPSPPVAAGALAGCRGAEDEGDEDAGLRVGLASREGKRPQTAARRQSIEC